MRMKPVWILSVVIAWVLWCVLVIQVLVPAVQRHFDFYQQLIAIVFCLLPVLIAAGIVYFRVTSTDSE